MRLILASASPRRAELLTSAGYTFEVVPTLIDETPRPDEPPRDYALRVAGDKARAVPQERQPPGTVILSADTVVVARGELLGKPSDRADAQRMLVTLAGEVHEVHTAVVAQVDGNHRTEVVTTRVRFVPLTPEEIAWYVASGEPEGKAGGYAIQGRAARFIDWIEGSWSNVVGLPLATVHRLLKGP
jgi:septum formation protein